MKTQTSTSFFLSSIPLPVSTLNVRSYKTRWRVQNANANATTEPDEIRVCTNRTCRRQGSMKTLETLSGLAPPGVPVKPCGCLGRCGAGPNLVTLPNGVIFSHCGTAARAAELVVRLCGREATDSTIGDALSALALRNRAVSEIEKANFSEANLLLTQAMDMNPFGGLHIMFKDRSVARLAMGDHAGALEDSKQALTLALDYSEAYICQGDAFLAMGQYDLAEKSYLKCLKIDPSLRRSKSFKALIANLQKKLVDADMS